MTIPIKTIVNVTIDQTPLFPQRRGFGTGNIIGTSDVITPEERIRFYTSIDEVITDFGPDADETKAAQSYFSQDVQPVFLGISRRVPNAYSARVSSGPGKSTVRGDFLTISDGSFAVTIDSVLGNVTGCDFTGIAAGETQWPIDVATAIQVELRAADASFVGHTCTWDAVSLVWRITSSTTGTSSTITLLSDASGGTPIKDLLDMGNAETTTLLQGADAETPLQAAVAARDKSEEWYGLLFTKEVRDDVSSMQEVAAWIESQTLQFATVTHNTASYDTQSGADLGAIFATAGYMRSNVIYHGSTYTDEYPDASLFGRMFPTNFSGVNTVATANFKNFNGISTNDISSAELAALQGKSINCFVSVGGNRMYTDGSVSSGIFFDEVHGLDWLQNAVQTNAFGVLYTATTKIPYTDEGAQRIVQGVEAALQEAVTNGFAAPGYTSDGRFLSRGYETQVVPVKDVPPSDRSARVGPTITFTLLGAGAIHRIQINGTFIR